MESENGNRSAAAVFGPFRFDLRTLELSRNGLTLPLEEQPSQALRFLIERAGTLVGHDDLRQLLWPNGVHVDYEHGVHKSINKLRTVLGDDPNGPLFIATLRGRGYRFIAPVELTPAEPDTQPGPAIENGKTPAASLKLPWHRNRGALSAVSALFLVLAAITGGLLFRSGRRIAFSARDWVLVAGFENRTGEPLFDGTLQYALERELSDSRFENVVPRERVEEVLRMMKRPADTSIDTALAREICLRDGGIRALLTGQAEKLGSTYIFSVRLIEPQHGTTVRAADEHAEGRDKVWPAVRKLSNWVRRTLGEELPSIAQSDVWLEKVTTPSLRALQLYTEGQRIDSDDLLRQAIQEDPDFAMAHMMLSCSLWNHAADWRPETERALQLSSGATERERLFIQGGYYLHLGQLEKAADAFQALLAIYPDDPVARGNLSAILPELGRSPEVLLNSSGVHASDYGAIVDSAIYRATIKQDLAGARRYIERARLLETPATEGFEVKFFSVHESWLRDDPASGLRQLDSIMNSLDVTKQRDFAEFAGQFYLAFGKLQAAEKWFRGEIAEWEGETFKMLALAAYLRGDQQRERLYLAAFREHDDWLCGICPVLQARMGPGLDPDQFSVFLRRVPKNSTYRSFRLTTPLVEGEYALAQGQTTDAISLLRRAADANRHVGSPWYFVAAESLANALERHGEPDEALRVLEQASRDRLINFHVGYAIYGVFWIRIQAHLAQRYREMGRTDDGREIEERLHRLLAYADPDYSVLRQLKAKTELSENAYHR